jgi:hypothetical protein
VTSLGHHWKWRTPCAIAAAAIVAGCSPTEPEMDTGLIVNGGFELTDQDLHPLIGSTPAGWFPTIVTRTSQYHTFALDSDNARSGRHSAMISIHPDHPSDVISYNWLNGLQMVSSQVVPISSRRGSG